MELIRQIDYKNMTLGEAYELHENKNMEFECDGNKHKLLTKIKYNFRPVQIKKGESKSGNKN